MRLLNRFSPHGDSSPNDREGTEGRVLRTHASTLRQSLVMSRAKGVKCPTAASSVAVGPALSSDRIVTTATATRVDAHSKLAALAGAKR